MQRRDFLKTVTGVAATFGMSVAGASAPANTEVDRRCKESGFPKVEKLTARVAEFVVKTQLSDIPNETIELGKKSILDGLGLALSGSKAETAALVQKYVKALGCGAGG